MYAHVPLMAVKTLKNKSEPHLGFIQFINMFQQNSQNKIYKEAWLALYYTLNRGI